MTWTGGSFSVGQILTAAQMNNLQADITAHANGDAGAPKNIDASFTTNSINANKLVTASVTATQLGSNSVHTSEIYELSGSSSASLAVSQFTMTGGLYCFTPQVRSSSGSYTAYIYGGREAHTASENPQTNSTSFVTQMSIGTAFPGTITVYSQWYYISASPPHDMGDGDIPLFLYALVDKNGKVVATHFAEDPVWLGNGPTNAVPNAKDKDGNRIRLEKILPPEVLAMPVKQRIIAARDVEPTIIQITEELKHRDMNLIPHPWTDMDLVALGLTVVMMDPVSDTVRELSELRKDGEDLDDILYGDYVKIGNTGLNRVTPNGLLIPSTTWK